MLITFDLVDRDAGNKSVKHNGLTGLEKMKKLLFE